MKEKNAFAFGPWIGTTVAPKYKHRTPRGGSSGEIGKFGYDPRRFGYGPVGFGYGPLGLDSL